MIVLDFESWCELNEYQIEDYICDQCHGDGTLHCWTCNGTGICECDHCGAEHNCGQCDKGRATCEDCHGAGHYLYNMYNAQKDKEMKLAKKWGVK